MYVDDINATGAVASTLYHTDDVEACTKVCNNDYVDGGGETIKRFITFLQNDFMNANILFNLAHGHIILLSALFIHTNTPIILYFII